jgi:hypothetical protein
MTNDALEQDRARRQAQLAAVGLGSTPAASLAALVRLRRLQRSEAKADMEIRVSRRYERG